MNKMTHMKISEFSKKTGISRDKLIFYDSKNLISPQYRDEKGYRYYTNKQLTHAYLITILRTVGVSIEEIKNYYDERSPKKLLELFSCKEKAIDKEITKLLEVKEVMKLYSNLVEETNSENFNEISIQILPKKKLFAGLILNEQDNGNYEKANLEFYKYCNHKGLDLMYPFGMMVSKENILKGNFSNILRCFFAVPNNENLIRPEGRYVIGYTFGNYGNSFELYERLMNYITKNELVVCGDSYEEYPYNEITTKNEEEFLIKVMIPVKH
ncbi:MerR family transcriptional regulator [Enterococcus canintestini]|uniref:MerR family transcriptional regulator n=1 Tax=Enterococcus canintestini TaxID=317010 RepID=UPI002891171B|nr:MerR family transcriptional regulator [Enterococcus canintestini]MDT2738733.1 MerR family transcriptional regulator [Enterococcus canintestini]